MRRIHEAPSTQISPQPHKCGCNVIDGLVLDFLVVGSQLDHGFRPEFVCAGADLFGEGGTFEGKAVVDLGDGEMCELRGES